MDDLASRYGPEYPPVRDYRKLKGNMEAQETVSCVILMVNAMLRLCETPAIKRILEADDMEIRSLGTGPGAKSTHKYISELLGEMTIDVRNDGRTFGAHGNSNIQNSVFESGRTGCLSGDGKKRGWDLLSGD